MSLRSKSSTGQDLAHADYCVITEQSWTYEKIGLPQSRWPLFQLSPNYLTYTAKKKKHKKKGLGPLEFARMYMRLRVTKRKWDGTSRAPSNVIPWCHLRVSEEVQPCRVKYPCIKKRQTRTSILFVLSLIKSPAHSQVAQKRFAGILLH